MSAGGSPPSVVPDALADVPVLSNRWTRADTLSVLVLSVAALAMLQNVISHPERILQEDIAFQWEGMHAAANEQIWAGRFPHWNPYSLAGQRLFADAGLGLLYPGSVLFRILPFSLACVWTYVLHFAALAAATYMLARFVLSLSPSAALVSSAVFSFGGFALGHTNHLNFVMALPWLPLLLVAVSRMATSLSWIDRWWLLAVLSLSMMLFSGGIPILFMAVGLLAWAGMVLPLILFPRGRRQIPAVRLGARLATAGLAVAGLTAVQWLPTLNLYSVSARADWDVSEIGLGTIPWRTVAAQVIAPGSLGDLVTQALFHLDHEAAIFIGGSGLAFVVIAFLRPRGHAWTLALAALAAVSVLLALRESFDWIGLQRFLPVKMRQPARFVCLLQFALALLAGIGCDRWLRSRRYAKLGLRMVPALVSLGMIVATLLLISWLAGAGATPESIETWRAQRSPGVRAWLADLDPSLAPALTRDRPLVRTVSMGIWSAAGMLLFASAMLFAKRHRLMAVTAVVLVLVECLCFSRMTWMGQTAQPQVLREDVMPIVQFLRKRLGKDRYYLGAPFPPLWANRGAVYHLANAVGYIGSMLNVSREHAALIDPRRTNWSVDLLALFGVKYIVLHDSTPPPDMPRVFSAAGYGVYEIPPFAGRAMFVDGARRASPPAPVQAALSDQFSLRSPMLVEIPGKTAVPPVTAPSATDQCEVIHDRPGDLQLRTRVDSNRALLLCMSHDSGWSATMDHRPIECFRANGCFLGLFVLAGEHLIHLTYRTPGLIPGLCISVVTGIMLLALFARARRGSLAAHLRDTPAASIQTAR